MSDPWRWFGYLPWALLLGGLLFAGLGGKTLADTRRQRETWQRARGVVVGSRSADTDTSQVYLQVSYEYLGTRRTFWNRYSSTPLGQTSGREVDILVNPEDPQEAVVARGAASGGVIAVVFVLFGVVALTVGLVLLT